jgi:hypothetical protein
VTEFMPEFVKDNEPLKRVFVTQFKRLCERVAKLDNMTESDVYLLGYRKAAVLFTAACVSDICNVSSETLIGAARRLNASN